MRLGRPGWDAEVARRPGTGIHTTVVVPLDVEQRAGRCPLAHWVRCFSEAERDT